MIKFEVGKCCTTCDYFAVEAKQLPEAGTGSGGGISPKYGPVVLEYVSVNMQMRIGCAHRYVCGKYLNEPIKAIPVEDLFKDEISDNGGGNGDQ